MAGPTLARLVGVGGGEAVDLWAGWSWIPEYHSSGELCIPSSSPLFLSLSFPFLPWVVGDKGRGCWGTVTHRFGPSSF